MALKIRLSRGGSKKRPYYRIVLADTRAPRDGRYIEKLGTYNPLLSKDNDQRVTFDKERVEHWLKNGAKPSDRVIKFLSADKIMEDITRNMFSELVKRNKNLPPSESLKITTMAGCSAVNK